VSVRVHALRFQRYSEANGGTHVYRFPVEVELLSDDGGLGAALAKPLAAGEAADRQAPVVVRDPRRQVLWQEMAQVTGRTLDSDFTSSAQLAALADEFDLAKKEQHDNIKDEDIFDPNNDDIAKRRGSPDPNWGNIVP